MYTPVTSPPQRRNSNHRFAPRAEPDAMSVDSMPFEASRYDNLELVQRRGSIQHKRLVPAIVSKKSG
jgi:hypothetical protein